MWNLFLDDERFPADVTWAHWTIQQGYCEGEWEIARNLTDVIVLIEWIGTMPQFVSFDHDLGSDQDGGFVGNGLKVAQYLIDLDMDTDIKFPDNFAFYVHSKNPVGKANIEGLMNGYLRQRAQS